MPELPEVETVVRTLRPHLAGRVIWRTLATDARVARTPLAGFHSLRDVRVREVSRVGKYIRIGLGGGRVLVFHLGMAGRLVVTPIGRPVDKHTYFRVSIRNPKSVIRNRLELRFINPRWCMGGVWLVESEIRNPRSKIQYLSDPTAELGPDPLKISQADFVSLFRAHRRQIKALLLDQRVLAGMGNIYCDESLFAAGVHPQAVASRLTRPRLERLWRAMRGRLAAAIRRGGSTLRDYRDADGREGRFQFTLRIYGRQGMPCLACGATIRHAVVAGRSTHFCQRCQTR